MDNIDRITENQVVLLNLLAAIAERLTGEIPSVNTRIGGGGIATITPDTSSISWCRGDSPTPYLSEKGNSKYVQDSCVSPKG